MFLVSDASSQITFMSSDWVKKINAKGTNKELFGINFKQMIKAESMVGTCTFCDSTDLKRKKKSGESISDSWGGARNQLRFRRKTGGERLGGMKKDEDQENQDDDLESNKQ